MGCRCPGCVDAHVQESRERRRALAEERFTAEQRQRVLELTAQGTSVAQAAQEVGVTIGQVYGRATWDLVFSEAFDEAGWTSCALGSDHPLCSTPAGYRGNERGLEPRPACRGTGCREWRRGMAQRERATAAAG
ncbi:hypothetical protein [Streptomyces sp. NPDC058861]|uniref:hypothetical protein n=1 Tax=Streptomyces sp. NPDC058861 TaxID=3346653 RepID=UPI0036B74A09